MYKIACFHVWLFYGSGENIKITRIYVYEYVIEIKAEPVGKMSVNSLD